MDRERHEIGRASGFSVETLDDGTFRWSAFGPRGTRTGRAATREEAEAEARAAERELTEPERHDPRERST